MCIRLHNFENREKAMNKTEREVWMREQIADFEKKHGKDVAYKWGKRWIKKKDLEK